MADPRRAALEQLSKSELIDLVLSLMDKVEELSVRVASLERTSQTSSKPPSSDYAKAQKRSKTNRQGKKTKGRTHRGTTRLQISTPTEEIPCAAESCAACGESLLGVSGEVVGRRQEFDLPPIQPIVREYQLLAKVCRCGHRTEGSYPAGMVSPVQLGPVLKSFLIYLKVVQLIPFERLSNLCDDLFNFSVCKRSIENALEAGYKQALPLYTQIMAQLKGGSWIGSDETGYRVGGKRWWMWVWQGVEAVYYAVHPGRGYEVVKQHFGEDYQGALVHDCWSAQNNTQAAKGHQQCHCHLDRDAEFLIEKYRSVWAYELQKLLLASQRAREKIYAPDFDAHIRQKVIEQYEAKLLCLIEAKVEGKALRRLQKRIKKHQKAILFFMHHPDVPFHNNAAERAIRMAKVQQKISGGHRSQHGAQRQAVLLSVIETAKRNQINLFEAIKRLLSGKLAFG